VNKFDKWNGECCIIEKSDTTKIFVFTIFFYFNILLNLPTKSDKNSSEL